MRCPTPSPSWAGPVCWTLLLLVGEAAAHADDHTPVVVDPGLHFLGAEGPREWEEFDGRKPEGTSHAVRFDWAGPAGAATLRIRQQNVKLDWPVTLNGRRLGLLTLDEADLIHTLPIPEKTLRARGNELRIGPPPEADDAVVGEVEVDAGPAVGTATLAVRVREAGSDRPFPCRVTVVDARGVLVPVSAPASPRLAVRPGVAYTADGEARLSVRPGRYTVYATRGFEFGLATAQVDAAAGTETPVALAIVREVPTPGLVACDTHIHTRTLSGHGDATLDERMVTIAGEGVELPVAAEHNRLADYARPAEALELRTAFTPVVGDEVTTRRGHFNAMPFALGGPVPDAGRTFWPELMDSIRAGNDRRFVILNHPRDDHNGFRPFGPSQFNAASGEDRGGTPYTFDAVEVVNSGALQTDPMLVVRDWFALWNHGQEVTAVAGSDSHDVTRFIVGQGRTYVACADADPGEIDVDAACRSLREGRAVVSLGLLADLKVDGRFGPGDLATRVGENLRVTVRVLGPSWVAADRVELYANGVKVREERLTPSSRAGEKGRAEWSLPKPPHDVALVAVASGPGVRGPYWAIPRPYQPASRAWDPRVLSVTNPVRVDADGSGGWNSPRYYAQLLIEIGGTEPGRLFRSLAPFDEAVATQAAAFCLPSGQDHWTDDVRKALETAPPAVRRGFDAYLETARGPAAARRP